MAMPGVSMKARLSTKMQDAATDVHPAGNIAI